ncbi:MAG: uroporphyrinogen decarboxylase family protein, partial [bacterium]|nr:uroporphyrinogen decarboxylase family protein [bacterium]
PDRMGCYEHFWSETLGKAWPEQGYTGDDHVDYFGLDMRLAGGGVNTEPFPGRRDVIEESAEWQVVRDGHGATLKYWKERSGTPEHIGFEVTTPEKWQEYREPLLQVNRERLVDIEATKKQLESIKASGKFSLFGNKFIFEHMRATMGDENFLPALLLEPEWINDFCQVYLDFFREHYALLFSEAGVPDGFFVYEDMGYSNGLFCSPRVLKELTMPYEKAWVSFLKDYGIKVILHSCGDIRQAIPLIIEAGFDCLQPMEAKAGCNVLEIAKEYGTKLSYMGNMNVVVLNTNDRAKIKEEIVPKLKGLSEMRIPYIFHSDHSVPPTINLDTYKYALELLQENGKY